VIDMDPSERAPLLAAAPPDIRAEVEAILPDDVPSHPYAVAMECAMLVPKAEVSIFPGKSPRSRSPWRFAKSIPSSRRIGPLRGWCTHMIGAAPTGARILH
jgi:hypothetical protein